MRLIYCLIACLFAVASYGQDTTNKQRKPAEEVDWRATVGFGDSTNPKQGKALVIDNHGIAISNLADTAENEKLIDYSVAGLDIGVNSLVDNSNYSGAAAQGFLNVPENMQNENLFSLRNAKSWNVNLWPILVKARLQKSERQKVYLSSGIGLQIYNFRFNKDISYLNATVPEVILDTVSFSKNKLALMYLSIPLSFTLKTNLGGKVWLVYGAGVTGGYRISSWTKQISGERGKEKNHDAFNFSDFNACVTGEIGISGILRLYASYQLTALHETALDQRPFCIGLRFGGV